MSTDKLAQREQIIQQWAQKILLKVNEIVPSYPNEADFRKDIDPMLDQFCDEIEIHPIRHHEYTLATGRADAVFNRLIIEYEPPGKLKKSWNKGTQLAVQQVKDYIEGLSQKERHKMHRLAGVAFDGYFCFVSAKFGPLMMFLKRWFAYNKITQGEMHEYQEKAIA